MSPYVEQQRYSSNRSTGDTPMGQRPDHLKPPSYLSPNPPVPQPEATPKRGDDPLVRDPVRYGDWELKGIAVDF